MNKPWQQLVGNLAKAWPKRIQRVSTDALEYSDWTKEVAVMQSIETRLSKLEGGKVPTANVVQSGGGSGGGGSTGGIPTPVPTALGGTGNAITTPPQGSVLYSNNVNVFAPLGPGTAGQVLTTQGAAANPSWSTPTGATTAVPPQWLSTVAYSAGNIVVGSDGNLYICVLGNTGNDPTVDKGTNWILFYVSQSLTLNIQPSGGRFNSLVTGTNPVWPFISSAFIPPDSIVTLKFADGTYNFSSQQLLSHAFGNQVFLTGNTTIPAICVLKFSAGVNGLNIQGNLGLIDGFTINGTSSTSGFNGIQCASGDLTTAVLGAHMIVENFDAGVFGAGQAISILLLAGFSVSNCNTCVLCQFGATLGSAGAGTLVANTGGVGVVAIGGSRVNVASFTITASGGTGIKATYGGYVYAVGATVSASTNFDADGTLSANQIGNRLGFIGT